MRIKFIIGLLFIVGCVLPIRLFALDSVGYDFSTDILHNEEIAVIDNETLRLERVGEHFLLYIRNGKGQIEKRLIMSNFDSDIIYSKIIDSKIYISFDDGHVAIYHTLTNEIDKVKVSNFPIVSIIKTDSGDINYYDSCLYAYDSPLSNPIRIIESADSLKLVKVFSNGRLKLVLDRNVDRYLLYGKDKTIIKSFSRVGFNQNILFSDDGQLYARSYSDGFEVASLDKHGDVFRVVADEWHSYSLIGFDENSRLMAVCKDVSGDVLPLRVNFKSKDIEYFHSHSIHSKAVKKPLFVNGQGFYYVDFLSRFCRNGFAILDGVNNAVVDGQGHISLQKNNNTICFYNCDTDTLSEPDLTSIMKDRGNFHNVYHNGFDKLFFSSDNGKLYEYSITQLGFTSNVFSMDDLPLLDFNFEYSLPLTGNMIRPSILCYGDFIAKCNHPKTSYQVFSLGESLFIYFNNSLYKIDYSKVKIDIILNKVLYIKTILTINSKDGINSVLINTFDNISYVLQYDGNSVNLNRIDESISEKDFDLLYFNDILLLHNNISDNSLYKLVLNSETNFFNKKAINNNDLHEFISILFYMNEKSSPNLIKKIYKKNVYLFVYEKELYFLGIDFYNLNIDFIIKYNIINYNYSYFFENLFVKFETNETYLLYFDSD